MNNNLPILHNINFLKNFIIFILLKQKLYIFFSLLFFTISVITYFSLLIDKKYIYSAIFHPNLQIPEILELRNDIDNKSSSKLDFNSYLASTINRFFTTNQNLYNTIIANDLLNYEEILSLEKKNTSEILDINNKKVKILKIMDLSSEKLTEPSDVLYSNENISINLYDHKITIQSDYNLNADYLFSVIINSYIIYSIESMKNYIDLYEESLKKNLVELNQKLLNAENENDLIENKGYIKFQLTNQILNYKNSLERLRNSSLVILIRNENNNDINFKDRNIKGLSNLFYTSEISKEIDYNYGLLSIMIFISLLITFILLLITYLNFLEYRSKN